MSKFKTNLRINNISASDFRTLYDFVPVVFRAFESLRLLFTAQSRTVIECILIYSSISLYYRVWYGKFVQPGLSCNCFILSQEKEQATADEEFAKNHLTPWFWGDHIIHVFIHRS